jgi:probable HAF family extracellular repeat protein
VLAQYTSHGQSIPAYSNGQSQWSTNNCDPNHTKPPFGFYGQQYQCTEYVKRFYYQALGVTSARSWIGDAIDYFASATVNLPLVGANNKNLTPYVNSGVVPPAPDDILVFIDSANTEGHVAIVTGVTPTSVTFIEQNWSTTGVASLEMSTNCQASAPCSYHIADRISYPLYNPGGVAFPVVGWLRLPAELPVQYTATDLGTLPGAAATYGAAINASGQIVGYSSAVQQSSPSASDRAFLYSGGILTNLGTLSGGSRSYSSAINDSGQVVGYSLVGGSNRAFLYTGGLMIDIGTLPGQVSAIAAGINDRGQIVGQSGPYAFLYSAGTMTNLGALPGATPTSAYGIR